jgi:predicted dehydrogenase
MQEMSADEVFERYCAIVGIAGQEADLARRGMYEDLSFLRCVLEGRPAFPDFRTALRAHEVVDACYRSAAMGTEERVPNP